MKNHTFVPRARYRRLPRRRRRYEPLYHSVSRLCSEFRDSRSFLWLNIKKSIHGKSPCIKKCGEIRQGPQFLVYIRKYPDFGYTKLVCLPVVRSDEGVNIFSGYVYGGVPKVRRRFEACRRRMVIFTSLKNNHMLAEITLIHRIGTCSLLFQKISCISFLKRFLVHTMVTRTHIL